MCATWRRCVSSNHFVSELIECIYLKLQLREFIRSSKLKYITYVISKRRGNVCTTKDTQDLRRRQRFDMIWAIKGKNCSGVCALRKKTRECVSLWVQTYMYFMWVCTHPSLFHIHSPTHHSYSFRCLWDVSLTSPISLIAFTFKKTADRSESMGKVCLTFW